MIELILLDRDGVLNADSADYIKSPEEWHPLPGAGQAVAAMHQEQRQVAICTNQSGLGRGLFDEPTLAAIHAKLATYLSKYQTQVEQIYWCPHHPEADCLCRKPAPGLLQQAMTDFDVSPSQTAFVGDSLRDLQAAIAARCKPVLVLTGNGLATAQKLAEPEHAGIANQVQIVADLGEAASWLLAA
jgi:D-glycero-D-manno-heptose 1,7-bisphosphate phosphatase